MDARCVPLIPRCLLPSIVFFDRPSSPLFSPHAPRPHLPTFPPNSKSGSASSDSESRYVRRGADSCPLPQIRAGLAPNDRSVVLWRACSELRGTGSGNGSARRMQQCKATASALGSWTVSHALSLCPAQGRPPFSPLPVARPPRRGRHTDRTATRTRNPSPLPFPPRPRHQLTDWLTD
jgi:hypothetical protein